jgi:serine/threonine protein phosphatase PrpC
MKYLVLATDGLTEYLPAGKIADYVRAAVHDQKTPVEIANNLAQLA